MGTPLPAASPAPRLPAGLGTGLSQAGGFHGPAEAGGDGACRLGRESGAAAGARGTAPPAAGSQNAERSRRGGGSPSSWMCFSLTPSALETLHMAPARSRSWLTRTVRLLATCWFSTYSWACGEGERRGAQHPGAVRSTPETPRPGSGPPPSPPPGSHRPVDAPADGGPGEGDGLAGEVHHLVLPHVQRGADGHDARLPCGDGTASPFGSRGGGGGNTGLTLAARGSPRAISYPERPRPPACSAPAPARCERPPGS